MSTPADLLDAHQQARGYLALARRQGNAEAAATLSATVGRYEQAIGAAVREAGGLDG